MDLNKEKPMIKLHHLNASRSKRIIWLLEELGVEYEIVAYKRDATTNLAPPELKAIHPLGKSPVLEDEGHIIVESGAITEYLTEKYGADTLMPARDTAKYIEFKQWMHFAEGSAMLPALLLMFLRVDGCKTNMLQSYAEGEMHKILSHLNNSVSKTGYLVGSSLSAADILNSFVIENIYKKSGLDHYPDLKSYIEKLMAMPGSQKAQTLEEKYL